MTLLVNPQGLNFYPELPGRKLGEGNGFTLAKKHMKNDYNPIAFLYDGLSQLLGEEYQKSKFIFLEEIKENAQVLYLGGGTGGNLIHLLKRVGEGGKVYYIEASSEMIERAEKGIPASLRSRVIFLHQWEFSEIPHIEFDWVITQYFLDILPEEEIHLLFQAMTARIGKDSQWLFVDFFEDQGKNWLIKLMIRFFQFFTQNPRKDLPDYNYFFKEYGWEPREKKLFKKGFIQAWLLTRKGREKEDNENQVMDSRDAENENRDQMIPDKF